MTTRAAQFEILAAGVQYNAALVTTPYVKFFAAGTDDAKTAWDDKDKASAITKKALDTQGRAEVFGDGIYKLKFYTGDPDADAPNTGVLLFEIDDYKVQASEFSVVQKTGTYTATPDDDVILCKGTFTLNIQTVANFERPIEVVNTGSGTVTIDPYSTETIEGSATLALGAGELVRLVPDVSGNIWRWVDFISDVATHAAATGTAVHGLGTMSTKNIAALDATILPASDGTINLGSAGAGEKKFGGVCADWVYAGQIYVGSDASYIKQGNDVTEPINRKIVEIGDWNMDSTGGVSVAHGLTLSKIRNVSVLVRSDDGSFVAPLNYSSGGSSAGTWSVDATNVVLGRTASGSFDGSTWDATSYNRGWIILEYVD